MYMHALFPLNPNPPPQHVIIQFPHMVLPTYPYVRNHAPSSCVLTTTYCTCVLCTFLKALVHVHHQYKHVYYALFFNCAHNYKLVYYASFFKCAHPFKHVYYGPFLKSTHPYNICIMLLS